jgi:diguanylate cyclase (GGDEF)-like protein
MTLYPLAGLAYGMCLLLVLLLLHHRDRDAVALLASATLVVLLAVVVWQALHIRRLRRLSAGLLEAARATPWPAATMDDILIRLVRDGLRAETVSLEPEPGSAATITEPIAHGSYLVARRSADDVRFSDDDRRLVAGLAALGRTSHIRAETERKLFAQAVTDELTGLWKYTQWLTFAEDQLSNRQPDEVVGVVFFDFDYFKQLNKTYGHLHADDVLAEVGRRLTAASRHWRFARFGGDEIVGLIREVRDQNELDDVCQQIQRIVAEPVSTGRYAIVATVTVGRVLSHHPPDRPTQLVTRADADLRSRKNARPALSEAPTSPDLTQHLRRAHRFGREGPGPEGH